MALLGIPQLLAFNISFDFFQLNLQKKRSGAVESIDSACSGLRGNSGLWGQGRGGGGVSAVFTAQNQTLLCKQCSLIAGIFQSNRSHVFDVDSHRQPSASRAGKTQVFFNLREVFEDLQMEIRREI